MQPHFGASGCQHALIPGKDTSGTTLVQACTRDESQGSFLGYAHGVSDICACEVFHVEVAAVQKIEWLQGLFDCCVIAARSDLF
eukprot:1445939-Amphidinium_carterae.1